MNTFATLINVALLAMVVKQMREHRIELRDLIRPAVLVGIVAANYLHGIPTSGNDLALIVLLAGLGVTLGGLCAAATHMRPDPDGGTLVRAGGVAAALWVAGIGVRLVFAYAVAHGAGPSIAHFSVAHHISGSEAWTAALVLMAISEVAARLVVLHLRAHRIAAGAGYGVAPAAARG
jgi:hypothetical protein